VIRRASGFALLLAVCAAATAAGNAPSTVSNVAESNGLTRNGYLQVRTPSVLRVEDTPAVPADARAAIDQYDRLLALDPDPVTRAEALRRAADLRVQLADADNAAGRGFHVADVRRAIAGYRRVLSDYPAHPGNDRVLYQLARAHQLVDESEPAIVALRQLGREHPQSVRAADADFRAGELLFARARFDEAAEAYAALLELGPDAAYHDFAQYKYAWSRYKQGAFEDAATVFLSILDRDLPAGTLQDAETALAGVPRDRAERARESLRVAALSFAALGGGRALSAHFESAPQASRMETMLYAALADALLEKERWSDAAGTYVALVERHPGHLRAPEFQGRAIDALRRGGFGAEALRAQETYVARYSPDAPYWKERTPDPAVMEKVRGHLDELARVHQARAQETPDAAARRDEYRVAATWYRRSIELFPQAQGIAATHLLLADALLESAQVREAARQYEHTAYALAPHDRAPVAALAAVQAWQRSAREDPANATDARRASIAACLRLADTFPTHPQRTQVLMTAAEDQYQLGELDAAIASAERVLQAAPNPALRRGALGVIADAHFTNQRWAQAETAYQQLAQLPAAEPAQQTQAYEQLASSVYRQAEAARDGGDLRGAATHFERVGQVAPISTMRVAADYDAAMALLALEDWPRAARSLEAFRSRNPAHRLMPEADKKLANAYERAGQPAQAAEVLTRIALRETEPGPIRREASWSAAQLYDRAAMAAAARRSFLNYLNAWPQPLDPAMQARQRLAELSATLDPGTASRRHWLEEIVRADDAAGTSRSEISRRLAAQAHLEIGRLDAIAARGIGLGAPLDRSLASRRAATERSVAALERAAGYGYADVTSAATYELAAVYGDLGRALLQSERPPRLAGEALEQYGLLLEEQAFPFEEKAIRAHEINLGRLRSGTWNDDIRKSVTALGELSPGKYAKQERREATYDALH
jgi:tetratricopeptide (TPR) repeat protein